MDISRVVVVVFAVVAVVVVADKCLHTFLILAAVSSLSLTEDIGWNTSKDISHSSFLLPSVFVMEPSFLFFFWSFSVMECSVHVDIVGLDVPARKFLTVTSSYPFLMLPLLLLLLVVALPQKDPFGNDGNDGCGSMAVRSVA